MEEWDNAPLYALTPPRLLTPPPITETNHGFSRLSYKLQAYIFREVVTPEYFIVPMYSAGHEDRKSATFYYWGIHYDWALPNPEQLKLDTEILQCMYDALENRPRSQSTVWACVLNS